MSYPYSIQMSAEDLHEIELACERSRCITTMSALDAGDLACEDEVVELLRNEDVTPNELGRALLRLRNEWAQRVAERVLA